MTTLALPFDKAFSCGNEQERKTLQPLCLFHTSGCWLILPQSVSLSSFRVMLDSVTPSPVEEIAEYVCVWRGSVGKKEMCSSLWSSVGKQTPQRWGRGVWVPGTSDTRRNRTLRKGKVRKCWGGLNQTFREDYFFVWLIRWIVPSLTWR